jgi:chromosome segregation ATPase
MTQPDASSLVAALQAASAREREARNLLIRTRDQLNEREQSFAGLEAELWAHFQAHESRHLEEIGRHQREAARLREEIERAQAEASQLRGDVVRLRVRLDRIQATPPLRLYRAIRRLPGVRGLAEQRTRGYEAALRRRLPS